MLRVVAVLLALCTAAYSEESGPREPEHKAEAAQANNHKSPGPQQITVPANSAAPTIINISTGKHAGEESQCAKPKDWKEWVSFSWCRSWEVLDAEKIIAAFTVVLAFATYALWRATDKLVRGAEASSQQQLRAYISANPNEISSSDREERFTQIVLYLKNHGQTPARELHYLFDFDVFPNPLPDGFKYPAPTVPIHADSSLFPQADMKLWCNFNRLLTTDEFNSVERDGLRLHIWGTIFYRTAFDQKCHTNFAGSVGGAAFIANIRAVRRNQKGPNFDWTWGSGHGSYD